MSNRIILTVFILTLAAMGIMAVYFMGPGNPYGRAVRLQAEQEEFTRYKNLLKESATKITKGMTRPEVERAVTEPPDHFSFDDKNGTVTWHWTAGSRKGPLMQESGDVPFKTDQTLTVLFDSQGKVADVRLGP